MLTVSAAAGSDPRRMTFFRETSVPSLAGLARLVTTTAWSPIIWAGGRRASAQFLSSSFAALDFDDGAWTVNDAVQTLVHNELIGLVGTTRSHQKVKDNRPAVDRFRLVMVWETPITDRRAYEQNMARLTTEMPADRACKDAGRFFWPCAEVVYLQAGGRLPWAPYAPAPPRPAAAIDTELRRVPQWMRDDLERGVPEGSRNRTAYRFAAKLKERGFSPDDAAAILGSGIRLDAQELAGVISSAFRRS